MKKIYLVAVVILFSLSMFAQRGGGQRMTVEERAQKTTEWMKNELKLGDDQIPKVDSINLLFAKTQQILFQSAEGDREKIRDTMTALEKEKETAFSKVLTPDQLNTYKKKVQEMMEEFRNRGGGRN